LYKPRDTGIVHFATLAGRSIVTADGVVLDAAQRHGARNAAVRYENARLLQITLG